MADFKTQITGLTDIAIDGTTSPTESEVTQYLVDAVKEVGNRIVTLKPADAPRFADTTNDASNVNQTGTIISVAREHDSSVILRQCQRIDANLRYEATDVDSLHYRSKYNPGYYVLNGTIYTVPAAGGSNNDMVVTQVRYDTAIAHGSSSISYFPDEYEYLVVLNACMKTLLNKMGSMHASMTDTSSGSIAVAFTTARTAIEKLETSIYSNVDNYDDNSKRFQKVKEAMDLAANLFDGDFPSASTDTVSYISQEDPEMIDKSLTALASQLKVAEMALTEMAQITDIPIKEAQMHLAEITSRLGADQQAYTWYNARYTTIKQEYDAAFGILAPPQQQQAEPQRRRRR